MTIHVRGKLWLGSVVVWSALALMPGVGAAPPRTTSGLKSPKADEPFVETPAVPYVTLALARDAAVHAELGLDARQVARVTEMIADVDESFWRLRDVPVKTCGDQLDKLQARLLASMERELSKKQLDRFQQIVLQRRSWKALAGPDLVEALSLTADQTSRLRVALKESLKERESFEKGLAGRPAAEQEQARRKQRDVETRRFTGVLTARQQENYRSRLGAPFDFTKVMIVGCVAPEFRQATEWINTEPQTLQQLRGQVVVVHFWAFGCINCVRNLPHYQGWHERFHKQGVTVIGVHTPETDNERKLDQLQRSVMMHRIEYPVLVDAAAANWTAWGTTVWPSVYLIDKQGRVRNWWYGELNWEGAKGEEFLRQRITELLAEK